MGKLLPFISRLLGDGNTPPDDHVPADPSGDDPDAGVLHQLRQSGSDLTEPTHVLFYLYTPTEAAARRIAARGADGVLTADVRPAASDDGTWLCLIEGMLVPSLTVIRQYREKFEALAADEGGEYDGWEAAVE